MKDFPEASRYECGPGHYFRFAETETQAPEVGYSVFVGIGQIVEVEKGVMDWKTPLRIRLQGPDKCPRAISDISDAPGTVLPKIPKRSEDGEHGLVMFDSGVVESELEDALVEGRSQVVDNFSKQDRKFEGNRNVIPEVIDVLREVSLHRTENAIGARLCVDVLRLKIGQNLCLVARAHDFETNRSDRRMIRFPDVD